MRIIQCFAHLVSYLSFRGEGSVPVEVKYADESVDNPCAVETHVSVPAEQVKSLL